MKRPICCEIRLDITLILFKHYRSFFFYILDEVKGYKLFAVPFREINIIQITN